MAINDQEFRIPEKQQYQPLMDERAQSGYARVLRLWTRDILPNPDVVRTVIDLYCGRGQYTAAELRLFTRAQVHAVDYYEDALNPILREDPRLTYHVGLVTQLLRERQLPAADFISIGSAKTEHGFTEKNVSDLVRITRGFLMTAGDNNHLEGEPWFTDVFTPVATFNNGDGTFWKTR